MAVVSIHHDASYGYYWNSNRIIIMSVLLAIISGFTWSLLDLSRKKLALEFSALSLSFWLVAAVTPLYALLWLTNPEWPAASYWPIALLAMALAAWASVIFIEALHRGHIGKLIPVLALTPVVAGILGWCLIDDVISLIQWLAIIVTVFAIIGLNGGGMSLGNQPGFGLMLLVAVLWGIGTVLDRWAIQYAQPLFHGLIQSAGVALLLLLYAIFKQQPLAFVRQQSGMFSFAVLVFIIAVSSQWYALQDMEAGILEALKRGLGILGALLWSVLLFKQKVNSLQVFWCCLIIAASAVIALL